jgi:hypothetical protein
MICEQRQTEIKKGAFIDQSTLKILCDRPQKLFPSILHFINSRQITRITANRGDSLGTDHFTTISLTVRVSHWPFVWFPSDTAFRRIPDFHSRSRTLRHFKQPFQFTAVLAPILWRTAGTVGHSSQDHENFDAKRELGQNRNEAVPFRQRFFFFLLFPLQRRTHWTSIGTKSCFR